MNHFDLSHTVIRGGYCIGCGACACTSHSPYAIRLNENGCFTAQKVIQSSPAEEQLAAEVCPFSQSSENEDHLADRFLGTHLTRHDLLGRYHSLYAGYVSEGTFREKGSSGGFGKWILCELLRKRMVDRIIQVRAVDPTPGSNLLYTFDIMETEQDVVNGSRSVYYPVEMSEVLQRVRDHHGSHAITGVPCFVKAIRLLQKQQPSYRDRIKYCIGIICGHLKSTRYADMLAWQMDVPPGELAAIDFRAKLPGKSAKQKGVVVRGRGNAVGIHAERSVDELFGSDYNDGLFQYRACDYCDDVVAETADISVGDAWLPQFIRDGAGTSLLVLRNDDVSQLILQARDEGRIHIEPLTVEQAVSSQLGGFRQRREGLAYRLWKTDRSGAWRPPKRVKPSTKALDCRRKRIYDMRSMLSEQSHVLFQNAVHSGSFETFRQRMGELIAQYRALYKKTWRQRIQAGMQRRIAKLKKRLFPDSNRSKPLA